MNVGAQNLKGNSIGKKTWKWALLLGTLIIVGLCLFLLRWRKWGFEWELFASSFLQIRWRWVAAGAALGVFSYYVRALRWAVIIKPSLPRPNVWRIFSATAIGFTAILFFGRPGEFVRPYLISVKESLPFSSQMAAWLLERIYDLLVALLIFGFALSRVHGSGAVVGPRLQWVLSVGGYTVGAAGAICLLILVLLRQFSQKMSHRLVDALGFLPPHKLSMAKRIVSSFVQGVEATRDRTAMMWLIFYSFLEWAVIAGCYFCVLRAFPGLASFRMTDTLIFMGFVSFGSIIQIPAVGGGVQLMSIVVLTELFKVPLETATGIAIMVWAITLVVVVPIGLTLTFYEGWTWQKLKSRAEEEASL